MASGASFRSPSNNVHRHPWLCRILALLVILFSANGFAQQTTPNHGSARLPTKTSPLLHEAEELLRQGSIAEAKIKIQDELQQNPSNVDGYNLLGIVFSDEKDYANALQSFQQALKLDSNSTRTHNNIGNLYVAQEKLDLAEKEFRKGFAQRARQSRCELQLGSWSSWLRIYPPKRFLTFSESTPRTVPLVSI